MACFAIAFTPPTIAGIVLIASLFLAEWTTLAIATAISGVTGPMAIWLAKMADSALKRTKHIVEGPSSTASPGEDVYLQRRIPFAIVLASMLPPLRRTTRVLLGMWWLGHFLAGVALVVYTSVLLHKGAIQISLANGLWAVLLVYAFHFAANVFLILGVTALFGSPKVTANVWRMRLVIDGLLTLPLLFGIIA